MKLWSDSFTDGGRIPGECAFAVIDPAQHVKLSSNRNPHLAWSGAQVVTLTQRDLERLPQRDLDPLMAGVQRQAQT
ncbi:MAG: hypothetical protein ACK58C_14060, partial [Betaproteobacteria bacterium]